MSSRFAWRIAAVAIFLGSYGRAVGDAYDPPAAYYSGATGTGATLKTQLTAAMSAGHILRNYGDFRFSAAITDRDPSNASNVLLVYNRGSVPAAWDNGITWNREHTWPDSRQPGNATNSATGAIADPHALRPCNPSINSSRSNDPYGFDGTTGGYAHVSGGYWYPGNADKGDMARTMFYMDTRWTSQGLSLVEAFPSGNQMGDLSSLVAWNYLDVPDEFERRRNQAVYSQSLNPNYYTNNRNAFVDRPWYAWSIYVNQANNSRMTLVGGAGGSDASATALNVSLGSVLVGAPVPTAQTVQLNKTGVDGTYFGVATAGLATSSITGLYNAYAINQTGVRSLQVGLSTTTASAGARTGTVTVDNLDVTTAGGAGVGGDDGNDVVNVSLSVLDHANASFAGGSDVNALVYDFGTVTIGSPAPTFEFSIFSLPATAGFTASLDLDGIVAGGSTDQLTTTLAPFTGGAALAAGASRSFAAMLNTSAPGSFSASYSLSFSDENLPGATSLGQLTLTLTGVIQASMIPNANFDADDDVDGDDFLVWQRGLGLATGATLADGDANGDHAVDGLDLTVWRSQFGSASTASAIPEPSGFASMFSCSVIALVRRRRVRQIASRPPLGTGAVRAVVGLD